MADTKKEQERDELHKAIWGIADDLRGSVDGWDFKQYVLGMMFYRYISENLANYINDGERAAGDTEFDYACLSDDEAEGARARLLQGVFRLGNLNVHDGLLEARGDVGVIELPPRLALPVDVVHDGRFKAR